jgi:UDP-N-acetyl-D-mannosaminuronate dehydrogenase
VDVIDPWANNHEVFEEYGFHLFDGGELELRMYSGIVLGVAHDSFKDLQIVSNDTVAVYDVKGVLDRRHTDGKL